MITFERAAVKVLAEGSFEQLRHLRGVLEKCGGPGGTPGPCPLNKPSAKPSRKPARKPKREDEIIDAELVSEGPSRKPTGHDPRKTELKTNVDNTVRFVHEGRTKISPKDSQKILSNTGLKLKTAEGGVEAKGHSHEQVVDAMAKKGWIKAKEIPDPDNKDFMLTVFEKGGHIATVHGQSEAKRKKLGKGSAANILPPHIVMSGD